MRIIETKAYSFAELSPEAQERAIEQARETAGECFDAEHVYEMAADAAKFLGLDIRQRHVRTVAGSMRYEPAIYYSGFWSQGDGACCEGSWRAADVDAAGIKAEFPQDAAGIKAELPQDAELHRLADEFARIAADYPDASFIVKHRGHYSHSGCTEFGLDSGCDDVEPDKAFHERNGAADDLKQAAREFMDWIYRALEREYEYVTSEEAAREYLTDCCGEEFDADGDRI